MRKIATLFALLAILLCGAWGVVRMADQAQHISAQDFWPADPEAIFFLARAGWPWVWLWRLPWRC